MKKSGFTLVELMIVVAIIGLVAAIAYPSYEAYIVRSKRADGMAAMLNAVSAMERHRAVNMRYTGAAADTTFEKDIPVGEANPYYELSLGTVTASTYIIRATPQNSMTGKDGALSINQAGVKTWTDKNGNTSNCWPESGNSC
ncbi:type IV pilin protein [Pleionea mediterranea]|uniref:Type IV pilus assembly protein PilE n=1 Tax=Pleionea mediterranea TaxID=523701 RepID=A0A316FQN8_9GAMM|nr:type IV pilin protein [Pleionea mediterranea]PWK50919.1 type IV pilus assembly protein PilE [Pleionea mediterranea]